MRFSLRLIAAFGLLLGCSTSAFAQPPGDQIFTCGKIALTSEAVGPNDPVLAIMSMTGINPGLAGSYWGAPSVTADYGIGTQRYTRANLGHVFGIAYDDQGIYVTAAAIYSFAPAWGGINTVPHDAGTGGAANQNRGSIYRIANHVITEIADLPNTGQGLGNITYDRHHNLLYVTNFYDGKIYIVNPSTGGYTTFDPTFDGSSYGTTSGFVPRGQRPWGIAVWGATTTSTVLYYARWVYDYASKSGVLAMNPAARNEIWSVNLDAAGNPIAASETLVKSVPGYGAATWSNPIADLEISTDGTRMLASERAMYNTQTSVGFTRLLELTRNASSSTTWAFESLSKFSLGGGGGRGSGGADYGDIDMGGAEHCNGTVYGTSDILGSSWGTAAGFQIMNPTGGDIATSILVDFDNIPRPDGALNTYIGDVDYRRCLDCPPVPDQCELFVPDTLGGTCCKGGLLSISPSGVRGVTTVSYSVTNGVVQGFTSNCTFSTVPAIVAGTTGGTIYITGTCTLQQLHASLQATSIGTPVSITWTVTSDSGRQCSYLSEVKGCPPPPRVCMDNLSVIQCNCGPNGSQSYLDINLTNAATPASTLCGMRVTYLDAGATPQSGFWASGSYQSGSSWIPITVSTSPVVYPALNIPYNGTLHTQLYFFGNSFPGSIRVEVIHCSGTGQNIVYDTCSYQWAPERIPPAPGPQLRPRMAAVKSEHSSMYAVPFRLFGPIEQQYNRAVKYWSVAVLQDSAVAPRIVAITGTEQYPEGETGRGELALSLASFASSTALFASRQELLLGRGDSSGTFTILFADAPPRRIRYSLYSADGGLITTDTLTVDSGVTVGVRPMGSRERSDDFLMIDGYPNPAGNSYTARFIAGTPRPITLSISRSDGEIVQELRLGLVTVGLHSRTIDLSMLASGIYMLRMNSDDGLVSEPVKIVIQR